MNARKGWLAGISLALALSAATASAQSPTGAIIGKAPPGTVGAVHGEVIGIDREVVSGKRGRYEARNLPPGLYSVRVGTNATPILVQVRVGTATRVP